MELPVLKIDGSESGKKVVLDEKVFGVEPISLLILAASTVLIWFFASKVFETVLYHNGNTVKLKELIEIHKSKKKNAQEPEVRNEK